MCNRRTSGEVGEEEVARSVGGDGGVVAGHGQVLQVHVAAGHPPNHCPLVRCLKLQPELPHHLWWNNKSDVKSTWKNSGLFVAEDSIC